MLDSGVIPFSQEKLRAALEKLRKDEKEFEKWKADIEEERTSWKAGEDTC